MKRIGIFVLCVFLVSCGTKNIPEENMTISSEVLPSSSENIFHENSNNSDEQSESTNSENSNSESILILTDEKGNKIHTSPLSEEDSRNLFPEFYQ